MTGITIALLAITSSSPTPAPSFSPSPIIVQVAGTSVSTVWLTGAFIVVAAMIAVFSLRWSDHRKLKGEDRRQWDKEILSSYVALAAEAQRLTTVAVNDLAQDPAVLGEANLKQIRRDFEANRRVVINTVQTLGLIAPKKLSEAARAFQDTLHTSWRVLLDDQPHTVADALVVVKEVLEALTPVRQETQDALRIQRPKGSS
jgi:hypothetical protein